MRLKLAVIVLAVGCLSPAVSAQTPRPIDKLSHVLVIFLENRSFDNLFGEFPGANGIANAGDAAAQRDIKDKPYDTLPPAPDPFKPYNPSQTSDRLAVVQTLENLPNKPFIIDGILPGVTVNTITRDLVHNFYTHRAQINGGKNDKYVLYSDAKTLTMGHYSAAGMKDTNLWKLAISYRLLDNFFQGAFGGSFLNHQWLVCACAPVWPDPPAEYRSQPMPPADRSVTAAIDGDYAVNTVQSLFLNNGKEGGKLLPPQTATTIGDKLSEKNVDWAWYSGGWDLASKAHRTALEEQVFQQQQFQYHHQPFAYYARFDPTRQKGREQREKHLRDANQLVLDIKTGRLPPVAFYKPVGALNQHAGYANILSGDEEVGAVVKLMQESVMKESFAVIVTYDEHGGWFDHVAPPIGQAAGAHADFFGPGARVPAVLVSPFVRPGVDSTQFDTTSILKLIAERHQLEALPSARFGAVESLSKAFDFSR